jgi:hypothetical protein
VVAELSGPDVSSDTLPDYASSSSSGFKDGLGERVLVFDRTSGDPVEHLHVRPELRAFEAALTAQAEKAAALEDDRFVRVRSVNRDPDTGHLVLATNYVAGQRLSEILEAAQEHEIVPDLDAALFVVRQLLPALSTLHETAGICHGALAPDRIIVTPDGQIVVAEHLFAPALERLAFTHRRLWSELRVGMPNLGGRPRFDPASDVVQIGLIGLALITGRPLGRNDYPGRLDALLREVAEIGMIRGGEPAAMALTSWFEHALPLPKGRLFRSADESYLTFGHLLSDEAGLNGNRAAWEALLAQIWQSPPSRVDLAGGDAFRSAAGPSAPRPPAARNTGVLGIEADAEFEEDLTAALDPNADTGSGDPDVIELPPLEPAAVSEIFSTPRKAPAPAPPPAPVVEAREAGRQGEPAIGERPPPARTGVPPAAPVAPPAPTRGFDSPVVSAPPPGAAAAVSETRPHSPAPPPVPSVPPVSPAPPASARPASSIPPASSTAPVPPVPSTPPVSPKVAAVAPPPPSMAAPTPPPTPSRPVEEVRTVPTAPAVSAPVPPAAQAGGKPAAASARSERPPQVRAEPAPAAESRPAAPALPAKPQPATSEPAPPAPVQAAEHPAPATVNVRPAAPVAPAEARPAQVALAPDPPAPVTRVEPPPPVVPAAAPPLAQVAQPPAQPPAVASSPVTPREITAEPVPAPPKPAAPQKRADEVKPSPSAATPPTTKAVEDRKPVSAAPKPEAAPGETPQEAPKRKKRGTKRRIERLLRKTVEPPPPAPAPGNRERTPGTPHDQLADLPAKAPAWFLDTPAENPAGPPRLASQPTAPPAAARQPERAPLVAPEHARLFVDPISPQAPAPPLAPRPAPMPAPVAAPQLVLKPEPVSVPSLAAPKIKLKIEQPAARPPAPRYQTWADAPQEPRKPKARPVRWIVGAAAAVVLAAVAIPAANRYWPRSAVPPGTIVVNSIPPGSEVIVDGRLEGTTPATVTATPGEHKIEVRRNGATRHITVSVGSGERKSETVQWGAAEQTGTLKVTTSPPGARVSIDGAFRGETPLTLTDLATGRHVVILEGVGGTIRRNVRIDPDVPQELDLPLYSGWVSVGSPVALSIYEGGRLLGSTIDSDRLMLPAGRHDLEFVNEDLGFRTTRAVDVVPGEVKAIAVQPQGAVNLNAIPWAEVFIDGQRAGETPLANVSVPLGTHEIVFRHPELGERRVTTTVKAGAPIQVSVDFNKGSGGW